MPPYQLMLERANRALNRDNIGKIDRELLGTTGPLDEFLRNVGICQTEQELEYLRSWPEGLKEVLRAAVRSAVHREPRLPVTFGWAPGYDYELNIWEAAGIPGSMGGMTILMRSRYPTDQHPAV